MTPSYYPSQGFVLHPPRGPNPSAFGGHTHPSHTQARGMPRHTTAPSRTVPTSYHSPLHPYQPTTPVVHAQPVQNRTSCKIAIINPHTGEEITASSKVKQRSKTMPTNMSPTAAGFTSSNGMSKSPLTEAVKPAASTKIVIEKPPSHVSTQQDQKPQTTEMTSNKTPEKTEPPEQVEVKPDSEKSPVKEEEVSKKETQPTPKPRETEKEEPTALPSVASSTEKVSENEPEKTAEAKPPPPEKIQDHVSDKDLPNTKEDSEKQKDPIASEEVASQTEKDQPHSKETDVKSSKEKEQTNSKDQGSVNNKSNNNITEKKNVKEEISPRRERKGKDQKSRMARQPSANYKKPRKSRKKEMLKKADEGDYKAYKFDPYSPQNKKEESKAEDNLPQVKEEKQEEKDEQPKTEEEPEEESEDDDWETKAENDEINIDSVSLRPNFGGGMAFSSTLERTSKIESSLYQEGSWSPQNPSGKKMYERDFLLKFQPYCREPMPGLPPIEVILGYSDKGSSNFAKKSSGSHHHSGSGQWQRGSGGFQSRNNGHHDFKYNKGSGRGRGRIDPPVMPVDQEGVWKPQRQKRERQDSTEVVMKEIIWILNKLTDEKFQSLSTKLIGLFEQHIRTVPLLKRVIARIFHKSLLEPGFSPMYAELCALLAKNCPQLEDGKTDKNGKPKPMTFKRVLLNRCQEEFEQKPKKKEEKEEEKESEQSETDEKREKLKQKFRMLGNIKFIGELYNVDMLTENIMHQCIFKQLLGDNDPKNPDEVKLEALCKLMTTCGKRLDHSRRSVMNLYFKRIEKLSTNKLIKKRIRFLLIDLIELRRKNWVTKTAVDPRTQRARRPMRAPPTRRPQPVRQQSTGSSRGSLRSAGSGSTGGWETVGAKKVTHETKGPSSRRKNLPSKGDAGGNIYSALEFGSSSSMPSPPHRRPSKASGSTHSKEQTTSESQQSKSDKPSVSDEKVTEETKFFLLEYLELLDPEEAFFALDSMECSDEQKSLVVSTMLAEAVEYKEDQRIQATKLLKEFVDNGKITESQVQEGFYKFLLELDEISVDSPLAPKHYGELFANGTLEKYLSFGVEFQSHMQKVVETGVGETVLASIFDSLLDEMGLTEMREFLADSNVDIMMFFTSEHRNKEFLVQWLKAIPKGIWVIPKYACETEIMEKLRSGETADEISSWWMDVRATTPQVFSDPELFQLSIGVVLSFITSQAQTNTANGQTLNDDNLSKEKELLRCYAPLLSSIMEDSEMCDQILSFVEQKFSKDLVNRVMGVLEE
eukprot:CAMPEP_0174277654 /NCGR_PEP_ID=MMETSP0439-20130205/61048_1 /TAXON_ID=0 /ORGANISM="Stereomyxa ramosa, Strain Chinc5" /LENGTH=1266 /DNA_ID=CAMNT_0015369991 /DNA_START=312 /DNA_END=4112 /DNA_ORIENTATION=+